MEFDWTFQAGQRSFTSETAPVPLRVPLAILASAPGRLSVPKLTVRVRFPSPAPHAKGVTRTALRGCGGEEYPYCIEAAGFAVGRVASGRSRPSPPAKESRPRLIPHSPDQAQINVVVAGIAVDHQPDSL